MFDRLRSLVLQVMHVPPQPEPPWGAKESVRVFRAGENYYKFRLFGWSIAQAAALVGILFWFGMLLRFERDVNAAKLGSEARTTTQAVASDAAKSPTPTAAAPQNPKLRPGSNRRRADRLATNTPDWLFPLLKIFEALGFLSYLAQIPLTYATLRLDYELRWYIVTDRSLRIRSGIWRLQESTMSFANIQQVSITRGPVQGLLKISDVRVESAGGGGAQQPGRHRHDDSLHSGVFRGVSNAEEIRNLILERLRQFRAAGLGDPDDPHGTSPGAIQPVIADPALAAAHELLDEARALRATLS